ncbi:MAG: beta strand repeat-containing protein [Caulobacteraceae bacterium]
MTTKILTGTYSAGYSLRSPITTLSLTSTGYAGGNGITTAATATGAYTVINQGKVVAAATGAGIDLAHGGVVTNEGLIAANPIYNDVGVYLGGAGVVDNLGTISSGGQGVILAAGSMTNGSASDTGALVKCNSVGVYVGSQGGRIQNFGTILSNADVFPTDAGVLGEGAANIANGAADDTVALIEGYSGVNLQSRGVLTNFGTVVGTDMYGAGAILKAGGAITNGALGDAGARIEGHVGVSVAGTGVVTNFGTIAGDGGDAVLLTSATDTLIVEVGSRFIGAVQGGGGRLDLASGSGTISGLANGDVTVSGAISRTTFTNFATLEIGSGARFVLSGAGTIDSGETVNIAGTLGVNGTPDSAGTIIGAGTLALTGGTTTFDAGSRLAVAHVLVSGAATSVDLGASNLGYGGAWTQTSGTLSVAAGGLLAFTGASNSFSGTLTGAGTIAFTAGADAFDHLTLAGMERVVGNAMVTLHGLITTPTGSRLTVTAPALLVANGGVVLAGGGRIDLGAASAIEGVAASAKLINVSDTIYGAGQLGGGRMVLVNDAAGIIESTVATGLTIDTGTNTIVNSGLIRAGRGDVTIESAIVNGGTLLADGGNLTVNGAVRGGGIVKIVGATTDFTAAFAQNVTFGASGVLELARSQTYTGTIAGFSRTGATSLDLADIAFGASTAASFSGTTVSGVLTVTDATHTARIRLSGDYIGSTFTVSSDGHGGTTVVDPAKAAPPASPSPHRLVVAMASLGAGAGGAVFAHPDWGPVPSMLAAPRVALA